MLRPVTLMFVLAAAAPLHPQSVPGAERVEFDSLDQKDGKPVRLLAWFFTAKGTAAKAPAVIALHGCGGLYGLDNDLNARHRDMAELLRREGYHVLLPDSFKPRGHDSICTAKIGTRDLKVANRRRDVFGALDWLATRAEVDRQRIALLGWSHGGSTVLSTNNRQVKEVAAHSIKPRAAVAFYPGCSAYLSARDGYRPNAPLLLLIGEKDDWTPPKPCIGLREKVRDQYPEDTFELRLYPDSYHDFDAPNQPLRVRKDVPNGVNPGKGVTVGSNSVAREKAYAEMTAFLRQRLAQ
ncbi:MAG TPA: dienelactone hydrolase family protein [Verrucomicrobiae bacterium]|nr:dienelactone hydrolase family protein [Verrucomicrobiae bacterium]